MIKVPDLKKSNIHEHPRFFKDFDKIIFKIKDPKSQISTEKEVLESLDDVLQKLEKHLTEQEFKTILLRFALYHYRFPASTD